MPPTAPKQPAVLSDEMGDIMHSGHEAEEPLSNPVLDPERMKSMSEKFRSLTGIQKPPKPGEQLKAPDPTPPPDSGVTPKPETQTLERNVPNPIVQPPPPIPKAGEAQKGDSPPPPPTPEKPDSPVAKQEQPTDFDPKLLSTSAREGFKRLQQSRDDYKKLAEERERVSTESTSRIKALEDELNKVKTALPPDIEEMRKAVEQRDLYKQQVEDLTKQVETINLERSPRFQNWWKTETDKAIKVAQRSMPAEKRDELAKVMNEAPSSERDARIQELVEGLPNLAQKRIERALDSMDELREQREEALQKGSEQWKKLKEHEQMESQKLRQEQQSKIKRLQDAALQVARALPSFQTKEGDSTHNQSVREHEAFIKDVIAGHVDEETMLTLPGLAIESLSLREQVKNLTEELARRDESIKALQASSPAPHDGGSTQKTSDTPKPGQAFLSRYREATRR